MRDLSPMPAEIAPIDAADFRNAMRLPASSVTVIATGRDAEDRVGVTVSAVCSLSDSPPMLLVCLNKKSHALGHIRNIGAFSVNFLARDQQPVAELFAGRLGVHGAARFQPALWQKLITGAPVFKAALAGFDCQLVHEHESPTHAILTGRVVAKLQNDDTRALIYSGGQFGYPLLPTNATTIAG